MLQAVLQSGLEYPLFYSVWHKSDDDEWGLSKLDLVKQLLLMVRESLTCRLWVAMDRWYLCKALFVFLEEHSFDWVTKAKRNTALYRKVVESGRRERYVPITPKQLIRDVYKQLSSVGGSLSAVTITDIYMSYRKQFG